MSDVFAAIGDATRRSIMERLRAEGPLSLTTLAEPLPMSRQGVTKHLDVLEAAGLIDKRFKGRERLHALSTTPLQELNDWLAPYEAEWDDRLTRLRSHLDDDDHDRGEDDDET